MSNSSFLSSADSQSRPESWFTEDTAGRDASSTNNSSTTTSSSQRHHSDSRTTPSSQQTQQQRSPELADQSLSPDDEYQQSAGWFSTGNLNDHNPQTTNTREGNHSVRRRQPQVAQRQSSSRKQGGDQEDSSTSTSYNSPSSQRTSDHSSFSGGDGASRTSNSRHHHHYSSGRGQQSNGGGAHHNSSSSYNSSQSSQQQQQQRGSHRSRGDTSYSSSQYNSFAETVSSDVEEEGSLGGEPRDSNRHSPSKDSNRRSSAPPWQDLRGSSRVTRQDAQSGPPRDGRGERRSGSVPKDTSNSPRSYQSSQHASEDLGSASIYEEETVGDDEETVASRSTRHESVVSEETYYSGDGPDESYQGSDEHSLEPDGPQSFMDDGRQTSPLPNVSLNDKPSASSFEDASFSLQGDKSRIEDAKSKATEGGKDMKFYKQTDKSLLASPKLTMVQLEPDDHHRTAGPSPVEPMRKAIAKEASSLHKQHSDRMDGITFAIEQPKLVSRQPGASPAIPSPERDQTPPRSNAESFGASRHTEIKYEPVIKTQRCKSLAILGTMSDAGKSIMTAGLCRVLANKGVRVAPFKGQNMSNNAAPALLPDKDRRRRLYRAFQTAVGGEFPLPLDNKPDTGYGEIGTAQSLQAEACRMVPRVEMNPVLLKSGGQNEKGEYMCSVFVLGQQVARETYGDLGKRSTDLRTMVLESHEALAEATDCEVILMEGAGSCTELNLMDRDIVNLPLVRALGCPWLLVANIDCGGVFAQIVGTQMCLSKRDWSLCVGIIVNKLRGEAKYFEPGPKMIEDMVGKPVFVVPFLKDLHLPEEDGTGIERRLAWESSGHHPDDNENDMDQKPIVVVVSYPHIAIADDICPLEADPRFRVQWRRRRLPRPFPHTTSVILPGSRLTRQDLKWLHDSGWSAFLRKHVAAGGSILGLCGGYQMLGWTVDDPHAVEGLAGSRQGLGLLPLRTTIALPELKVVSPRLGRLYPKGPVVQGFELHCGHSQVVMNLGDSLRDQVHPLLVFDDGEPEGMRVRRVRGTYLHGILWSPDARVACLVPDKKQFPKIIDFKVQDPLDRLAEHLESCGLDFETLRVMISSHRNTEKPPSGGQ